MTPAHITALCQPERIEVYIGLGLAALIGYGAGVLWPWLQAIALERRKALHGVR